MNNRLSAPVLALWNSSDKLSAFYRLVPLQAHHIDFLASIHSRMPVITPKDHHALWLDPDIHDPAGLMPILEPCPSDALEHYEVSPKVNSQEQHAG
jgi:putative SOS response-associated peptidase YedK